jgi:hypothetical protein
MRITDILTGALFSSWSSVFPALVLHRKQIYLILDFSEQMNTRCSQLVSERLSAVNYFCRRYDWLHALLESVETDIRVLGRSFSAMPRSPNEDHLPSLHKNVKVTVVKIVMHYFLERQLS